MQARVTGKLLHLSKPSGRFKATRVSVRQEELAGWNICRLGTLASVEEEDVLDCTYLTLAPSQGEDLDSLHNKILELKLNYLRTELARDQARSAVKSNRRPSFPTPPESPSSSASSRARSFVGLPSLASIPSLDAMFNEAMTPPVELSGNPDPVELDGSATVRPRRGWRRFR